MEKVEGSKSMLEKQFPVSQITALLAAVLLSLAVSAGAQPARVEWRDLPERVAGKMIPASELSVIDCPEAVASRQPSRLVMQVIENTFYKWYEYDLPGPNGETNFCIVMLEPMEILMTREEARVLKSASRLWTESASDVDETAALAATGPNRSAAPATESGSAENVIGSDDRIAMLPQAVLHHPWNNVCYLDFDTPSGSFRGSGLIIAPFGLLTAGHCVYDRTAGDWASTDTYVVAPGQYQVADNPLYRPHRQRTGVLELGTIPAYISGGAVEDDLGAILLDGAFENRTYMPVVFDQVTTTVHVTGYPIDVQGVSESFGQWDASGGVTGTGGVNNRLLRYLADTSAGTDGGPVWHYDVQSDTYSVLAIHVLEGATFNSGARFVNGYGVPELVQWAMTYMPSDDLYEENDTRATAHDYTTKEKVWLAWDRGLGIANDDDWYKIDVGPGGERVRIELDFLHAEGDLNLRLYNSTGTLVVASESATDDELIDYIVPTGGGIYYVQVYTSGTPQGNLYNLWWDDLTPFALVPPTNVEASNGTDPSNVNVTWNSVPGASHYQVYRATTSGGPKTAVSAWITETAFADSTGTPGAIYYYSVKAALNETGLSATDYSAENAGWTMRPQISIVTPTGSSTWYQGLLATVEWNCTNNPLNDQMYLSLRGPEWRGWAPVPCTNGANSAEKWIPVNLTPGTYRLRISWMKNYSFWWESDAFEIRAHPEATITTPAGGETWQQGTQVTVNWDCTNNPDNDDMYLSLRGPEWRGWTTVPCHNGANSVQKWIHVNLTPGTYRLRMSWKRNYSVWWESNPFTVIAKPSITVTQPSGGTFQAGSQINIQWNCTNNPTNDPVYISIKGPDWLGMGSAACTNGANSVTKTIPVGLTPGTYQIRLSWTKNYSVYWSSAAINVTAP